MFIWTISDAILVIVMGFTIVCVLVFFAVVGIDKVLRKFEAWRQQ